VSTLREGIEPWALACGFVRYFDNLAEDVTGNPGRRTDEAHAGWFAKQLHRWLTKYELEPVFVKTMITEFFLDIEAGVDKPPPDLELWRAFVARRTRYYHLAEAKLATTAFTDGSERVPGRRPAVPAFDGMTFATAADEWLTQFLADDLPLGKGLALIGAPGQGKTAAARAVLNTIETSTHLKTGFTTLDGYLKRERKMMKFNAGWERADVGAVHEWRTLDRQQEALRSEINVLLLDDIGREPITEFSKDEFDFLLRHRYDLGFPTLITSNLPLYLWTRRYSDSMESFAHEAFVIVEIAEEDRRK
jgi:hypothetical protein